MHDRNFFFHSFLTAQLQPHIRYSLFQLPREILIRLLRGGRSGRWANGFSDPNLQTLEELDPPTASPSLFEPIDGNWNDWDLDMGGQNGSALLKGSGLTGDAALAFRIQDERLSMTKAVSSGLHRRNKICVRIDWDKPHGTSN